MRKLGSAVSSVASVVTAAPSSVLRVHKHLPSAIDASQNWILVPVASYPSSLPTALAGTTTSIRPTKPQGHLECRYVKRSDQYLSVYVSSHYGCNMGCKFCHLTHLGEGDRRMKHATLDDYTTQLKIVLAHANKVDPVFSRINVNFMARGDCLSNATVVNHYDKLYTRLIDTVAHNQSPDTKLKMNLSTIMPASTMRKRSLLDVTKYRPVSWYYSLYSTNERFRREWMPRALPYQEALVKLKEFQLATNYEITIHFAFIKGANDDPRDVEHMCKVLQDMRFSHAKFNLVRFNPPPGQASRMQEPDMAILQQYEEMLRAALGAPAHRGKIIDRVGMDVAASCGMFVASR